LSFREKVENAFVIRKQATRLICECGTVTPEQQDALWFDRRDWRDVTWAEWQAHRDAFYAFTPETFIYYLPSILLLSLHNTNRGLLPADALLQLLDRSPTIEYWDEFLVSRLLGLQTPEYEVLIDWAIALAETGTIESGDSLGRAFDTIYLLRQQSNALLFKKMDRR
jgi:hypothetical protein